VYACIFPCMAVYLFTFHAYRSWNADRPQGFVLRGKGVQPTNGPLARKYDARASQVETAFSERHQRAILWIACDACLRRNWRLHGIATEATHIHLLVSWRKFQPWEPIRAKLKNLIGWALSNEFEMQKRKWLSSGGSRKQVENQRHFNYLLKVYLPNHRGLSWFEGEEPPIALGWTQSIGLGIDGK